MRNFLIPLLNKFAYVKELREEMEKQGGWLAGHYYSPIPHNGEIQEHIYLRENRDITLPDIDLNYAGQLDVLKNYQQYYSELPFSDHKNDQYRYFYVNDWFAYADAIFLYSFLRRHQPRNIIEVGSGFSSAVILDTAELFFEERPKISFIEPYPDRLQALLSPDDKAHSTISEKRIQEIPLETFDSLNSGDLLLIDSSHAVKTGGELLLVFFDILPRLPAGVFVHFHDIFYPFDYPTQWLEEGRYWNEAYFLRAFLSYNAQWSIYFFNSYVEEAFSDFLTSSMPLTLKSPGASIYLRKDK